VLWFKGISKQNIAQHIRQFSFNIEEEEKEKEKEKQSNSTIQQFNNSTGILNIEKKYKTALFHTHSFTHSLIHSFSVLFIQSGIDFMHFLFSTNGLK
jgi:hypothetical protein